MNKKHWDAMAVRNWPKKKGEFSKITWDPDLYLRGAEPELYPYLCDLAGKRMIVLQFGDACLLMACALKGARVLGVDLSSEQVRLAGKAAEMCDIEADLIQADCQNLPYSITDAHFDLAVAECGVMIWIANPNAWMKSAYRVLRRGGLMMLQDFHPLSSLAVDFRAKVEDGVVVFKRSYLDQAPCIYQPEWGGLPGITFTWKLSDIINAAIDAGFTINRLKEFYDAPDEGTHLIPNKYLLAASKE